MPRYRPRSSRPSLCSFPGCRVLTTTGRCLDHSYSKFASDWARQSKKFLNSAAWIRCREQKLRETPWCEQCEMAEPCRLVPATQVDHIKPRHSHPGLRLTMSNLQSLCDCCHGKKTRRGE